MKLSTFTSQLLSNHTMRRGQTFIEIKGNLHCFSNLTWWNFSNLGRCFVSPINTNIWINQPISNLILILIIIFITIRVSFSLADLRGAPGTRPPGIQILLFLCGFWQNNWKIIALLGVGAPPWGKSWIRHWFLSHWFILNHSHPRFLINKVTPQYTY